MNRVSLSIGRVALYGGVGGAINAALCYLQWPVPAAEDATFHWHIVPAGFVHGACLAAIAVTAAQWLADRPSTTRVIGLIVVGWLAGWLSYIALHWSINRDGLARAIAWPFGSDLGRALLAPFQYFGLVAMIAAGLLAWNRRSCAWSRDHAMWWGVAAGVLGSSWWWVACHPWYFSLLHGAIWGALVGRSLSSRPSLAPPARHS